MPSQKRVWAYKRPLPGAEYVRFPSEPKLYAAIREMADAEQKNPGAYRTTKINTYQRPPGEERWLLHENIDLTTW